MRKLLQTNTALAVSVEATAEPASVVEPVTIDQWLDGGQQHSADFSRVYANLSKEGKYQCSLHCYFRSNFVLCRASADTTGDAFLAAIAKIEDVIGSEWRNGDGAAARKG